MRNIRIYLLIIITILFYFSSTVHAEMFHDKQGREIEVMYKEKGKKFKAWGKVSGGKESCKQLNYSISFSNSESSRSAYVDGYIKNYRPNGRNIFSAKDDISKRSRKFKQKSDRYDWYVRNYHLTCLN